MAIIDHGAHGAGQWLAEAVATFGLLLTIFGCIARTPARLEVAPPWHGGQRLRELVQARRASRFKRRLRGGQPCRPLRIHLHTQAWFPRRGIERARVRQRDAMI
jgi:hypothetical protein